MAVFPIGFSRITQQSIDQQKKIDEKKVNVQSLPRYGTITNIVHSRGSDGRGLVFVKIRFDDRPSEYTQESYQRPFVLAHYVDELALIYGDNLIGRRVKVDYVGNQEDQGYATIINSNGVGDLQQANTLKGFQTLIAPAGS